MKKLLKIFIFSFFFSFLVLNVNYVFASNNYENPGYNKEDKRCNSCSNKDDYQLTTGLPFFGADVTKCACIPVNTGAQFFLSSILKFIMGSVATLTTIIIIVAGFRWGFSAGNKKIIADSQVMIKNAIIGLIMSLTSGLMLSIINPNLLKPQILEVENVDISASYVNSCGSMENTDYAKQRSVQLCRLAMKNNLPNKNGVIISWSVCDVSGVNCGKSQEVMSSNLDSLYDKSSGEYLPNCAYVNDHFGRFAIKIETITGFDGVLKFECSNDYGAISEVSIKEPKEGSVGTFCRGWGGVTPGAVFYCVNNKNKNCLTNPQDGDCFGQTISNIVYNVSGFSVSNQEQKQTPDSQHPFFDCIPEGTNYSYSDFEICAGGICTNGEYPDNVPIDKMGKRINSSEVTRNISNNPNMAFGIRIKRKKEGSFTIKCVSPSRAGQGFYNIYTTPFTIDKSIMKNIEEGSTIDFCIGHGGICGADQYYEIALNYTNMNILSSDNVLRSGWKKPKCEKFTDEKTSCFNFSIGNYYPCKLDENNECVNKQ